ncbi:hypothetical protein GCM10023206_16650 [Acinetobacter puyangensis]|uniref:Protein kinase domain-containing protein n=1 Tax=Acinetobacter puyangensis TaxID=1096779 RepID=A0A240E651_9GAMM|nr:protein kinase [Acinetobacter puyangensis]SNX44072.1 Protein kinase domain-containing protein [Acinetobacter puyangensis]
MFEISQPFQWEKCLSALPTQQAGQYVYLITQQEQAYVFKFLGQNAGQIIRQSFSHELNAYRPFQTEQFCADFQIYKISDVENINFPIPILNDVLVMPYYQTLNIDLSRKFSIDKKIQIFQDICLSVQHLHDLGYIHGDLKLRHITFSNPVKLLDLAQTSKIHEVTRQAEISATPAYMAPELFLGENISMQSDIYALGIIFYEILMGEKPFMGKNYQDWATQHCQAEIPLLAIEYSLYQNILDGMLAKLRKNRFSEIKTLINALNLIKKT